MSDWPFFAHKRTTHTIHDENVDRIVGAIDLLGLIVGINGLLIAVALLAVR